MRKFDRQHVAGGDFEVSAFDELHVVSTEAIVRLF